MKNRLCIPLLALGLAGGYGIQEDAKDDLAARVSALEERLDAVERYLAAQAEAEQAVVAAIDRAVEQGFTAGINFESRKTLVAAWRKRAEAARQGLPGKKKKTSEEEPTDPRLRRRGGEAEH